MGNSSSSPPSTKEIFEIIINRSTTFSENFHRKILNNLKHEDKFKEIFRTIRSQNQNITELQILDTITFMFLNMYLDIRYDKKSNKYYISSDLQLLRKHNIINSFSYKDLNDILYEKCNSLTDNIKHLDDIYKTIINYFCVVRADFINIHSILVNKGIIIFDANFNSIDMDSSVDHLIKRDIFKTSEPIKSLIEFGSTMTIIRALANDAFTNEICKNRTSMNELLIFVNEINKTINDERKTGNHTYIRLKGGNIFKLYKENFSIDNLMYNHIQPNIISHVDRMKREIESKDHVLSDWDFSISLHDDSAIDDLEKMILNEEPNIQKAIYENSTQITNAIDAHMNQYNEIQSIINNCLTKYQTDASHYWMTESNKIVKIVNNNLGNYFSVETAVNNTNVYPTSYVKTQGDDIKYNDENKRNKLLNNSRSVSNFNDNYKNTVNRVYLTKVKNTNLRVSDMEIWGKEEYKGEPLLSGFDLTRLTLNFKLNFKLFNSGIGDYSKTVFAELLDFSHVKPITPNNILGHGHEYDYDNIRFYQDLKSEDFYTEIQSYSLSWFINDVILMSLSGKSRKSEKRLFRLYESVLILMCKRRIIDNLDFSFNDFARLINVQTGKNLYDTLLLLSREYDKPFFNEMNEALRRQINTTTLVASNNIRKVGGSIMLKYMSEFMSYNILYIIIIILLILIIYNICFKSNIEYDKNTELDNNSCMFISNYN